ncbi:MAG: flagellar protein FlaG [Bacillota bacterium]
MVTVGTVLRSAWRGTSPELSVIPDLPASAVRHPAGAAAQGVGLGEVGVGATGGAATQTEEDLPVRGRSGASLLSKTADLINQILEESHRRLKFNVHQDTGRIWVQVINTETNEVIKEIPPERYLDLVARIWELVGIVVDERA